MKPKNRKRKKRVGRGGKKGTYSGKGMKGQRSRAGRKFVPAIRSLIKKYPKLRGYRVQRSEKNLVVVNLADLDKNFKDSEVVNPQTLLKKGLIRRIKGRIPKVKILGRGELTKKLIIEGCELSKSVKEKLK